MCCIYFQTVLVQSHRNVWGKVNKNPPRGTFRPNRHWDPKNKGLRKAKETKIYAPELHEGNKKLEGTNEILAMRENMKKMGIFRTNPEQEYRNFLYLSCTNGPLDIFIPPESEGKASILSIKVHIKCLDIWHYRTNSI